MNKYILIIIILYLINPKIYSQEINSDYTIEIKTLSEYLPDSTSIKPMLNPFSPSNRLGIDLNLNNKSFVKVDVMDTSMTHITTLFSTELSQGKYRIYWDADLLKKYGKYYYYLETLNFTDIEVFYYP